VLFAGLKKQRQRRLAKAGAEMFGADVTTKTRRGSLPATRSMRAASEPSRPLPANTSYLADGVCTRMDCTLLLS